MKKIDVENVLDEIGIQLNVRGYKYLIDAVLLLDSDEEIQTTILYRTVARKNNVTHITVERAITHCLKNLEDKIREMFKLNCFINNTVVIHAIRREVNRRAGV